MFRLMGKEINTILGTQTILIWTYDKSCESYAEVGEKKMPSAVVIGALRI